MPIYAFYPLLIVMFGLGDRPEILIGFMLAVVAVIASTVIGLDSVPPVLVKTARVMRLGPIGAAWGGHLALCRPAPVHRGQAGGGLQLHRRDRGPSSS
ncbi:MAG: hypothetical protein WDN45_01925 [Caulobacteraceae bacterium]